MNRRAQKQIAFRSDKAAKMLAVQTRSGRSQAAVIEDALERLAKSEEHSETQFERRRQWLLEIAIRGKDQPRRFASMAEFDAHEYDERGNPR